MRSAWNDLYWSRICGREGGKERGRERRGERERGERERGGRGIKDGI